MSKKKNQFSKVIVTLVVILNVLFTAGVLYVFLHTGNEPITLIGCWFAFTTTELLLLSNIKKQKIKKETKESEEENE